MPIRTNAEVAAKVRGVAAERQVLQSQVAEVLGISRMAVSRRFAATTPFTPEELIRLAQSFGVPVSTFFGETVSAETAA